MQCPPIRYCQSQTTVPVSDLTLLNVRSTPQELEKGGVDAAIAFQLRGGYSCVMSYFEALYHSQVSAVLQAAGYCQLYQKKSSLASGEGKGNGRVRVRWPHWVLERLASAALGSGSPDADREGLERNSCASESKYK